MAVFEKTCFFSMVLVYEFLSVFNSSKILRSWVYRLKFNDTNFWSKSVRINLCRQSDQIALRFY